MKLDYLLSSVTTEISPYEAWHDLYQKYYVSALRTYLGLSGIPVNIISLRRFPNVLYVLGSLRRTGLVNRILGSKLSDAFRKSLDSFSDLVGNQHEPLGGSFHPYVGQYLFHFKDGVVKKVCIDTHDSADISSMELMNWSDLYLKTNYWQDFQYPSHVKPLYNCNPLILPHISHLRCLRKETPLYDLCFVVRVWGGRQAIGKLEHVIRLIEAVARYPGPKYILACLVVGNIDTIAKRLESQNIPWTTGRIPLRKLWHISAQSRINVIRLGVEDCIPWRMIDLLAMGACPVFDQSPHSVWPQPLIEGDHFQCLHVNTPDGKSIADEGLYQDIPRRLEAILADTNNNNRIRSVTADYFDQFVQPEPVGRLICESVSSLGIF